MNSLAKQLLESMRTRFACKEFMPGQVISDEDYETILEAGRLAPAPSVSSPGNFYPSKTGLCGIKSPLSPGVSSGRCPA